MESVHGRVKRDNWTDEAGEQVLCTGEKQPADR